MKIFNYLAISISLFLGFSSHATELESHPVNFIESNNLTELQSYVEKQPNCLDIEHLYIAAKNNHTDIVLYLLEKGNWSKEEILHLLKKHDITFSTNQIENPLDKYIKNNDFEIIKLYLTCFLNPTVFFDIFINDSFKTAIQYNRVKIIKLLLDFQKENNNTSYLESAFYTLAKTNIPNTKDAERILDLFLERYENRKDDSWSLNLFNIFSLNPLLTKLLLKKNYKIKNSFETLADILYSFDPNRFITNGDIKTELEEHISIFINKDINLNKTYIKDLIYLNSSPHLIEWALNHNINISYLDGAFTHIGSLYPKLKTVKFYMENSNDLNNDMILLYTLSVFNKKQFNLFNTDLEDILYYLLENRDDKHIFTKGFIAQHFNLPEITLHLINKPNTSKEKKKELIQSLLLSSSLEIIHETFQLFPELKDAYIIGLTNQEGEWTGNVIDSLRENLKQHENGYILILNNDVLEDLSILEYVSAFINPGGGDAYPRNDDPFNSSDFSYNIDSDFEYQTVLEHVLENNKPYLGICAGNQHLILRSNGSLIKKGHHSKQTVHFKPGTLSNFNLLNTQEKSHALSQCKINEIIIKQADSAHGYSGYPASVGDLNIDALSHDGILEAVSRDGNKFGIQFHPENHYLKNDQETQRQRNYLNSIFTMFHNHYKTLQYAKKHGNIDVARKTIREFNLKFTEDLNNCIHGYKVNATSFWNNEGNSTIHDHTEEINLQVGVTPDNIIVTMHDGELFILSSDGKSSLKVKIKNETESFQLNFADGSVFNINLNELQAANFSKKLK